MFKKLWQWITRNTFNGKYHDWYADMTPEEHQALIDQNIREAEYMLNEHEANLADMALEQDHADAIVWNNICNCIDNGVADSAFAYANHEYRSAQLEDDEEN